MEVLAIIPARGGSKGIPKKNIVPLNGIPLIAYSIQHAIMAEQVSRIVVSTDDNEIAEISQEYGAEVIKRPDEISGDYSSSESSLVHVLDHLRSHEKYDPDVVVFLQATSPIRRSGDIDGGIKMLVESGADSCLSACPEHFRGRWNLNNEGFAVPVNFEISKRPMRQNFQIEYVANGSFWIFKPWVLHETGNRIGGNIALYSMHPLDSYQVDVPEDLVLMDKLLRIRKQNLH